MSALAAVARCQWCKALLSAKRHALTLDAELALAEADYQRRAR